MKARDDLLKYLEYERRVSPHTLEAYRRDLDQFIHFLQEVGDAPAPGEIVHGHVRGWVVALVEEGASPVTVERKLSSLRAFFRYLKREKRLIRDPMLKVTAPKKGKRLPAFVSVEDMQRLFREVDMGEGFAGLRDRLLLELLYCTGMRRAELIGLQEKNVDPEGETVKILGKRDKERLLPIPPAVAHLLKEYSAEKRSAGFTASELLVTDKGKKLYPKFVHRKVNYYLGKVTSLGKKSPHVLRHTFATHMLAEGADLNAIKELLGHASLSATQVYTHNSIGALRDVHKRSHPRG